MRERATQMMAADIAFVDVCRTLGLPRGTVTHRLYGKRARRRLLNPPEPSRRLRRQSDPGIPEDTASHTCLLGLHLGDGHLVTGAKVSVPRVSCADSRGGLFRLCEEPMLAAGGRRVQKRGCVSVHSYSKHRPRRLPRHGPGEMHGRRPRSLTNGLQPIVDEDPGRLLRGLIHSDGCRVVNRIVEDSRMYEYPRYPFSNEPTDIMGRCQQSLDRLGISCKMCRRNMLSVAGKESIVTLDQYVGPTW